VGGAAGLAAAAALRDGADWVGWCVAETKRNRDRLGDALRVMGLAPLPSTANFVLLPLPAGVGGSHEVAVRLRERGVGVRPFEDVPGIGDCLRVTVGPWSLMQMFLDALADAVPAGGSGGS
jgi:histidinol-phosphate/aromatic aminotransferase/cobyric acid decarboxylase-like protein